MNRPSALVGILLALGCTAFALPPAHATVVGRTPGTFTVSPVGAATYSIPIWVPSGPNGLQPNVALTYDSTQGIGPVGIGWSVSGLSSIYRCNRTYAQDAVSGPVTLTASDVFCMDGKRVRLTAGTYGAAGSTYQTEIADFSTITAYGAAGNGPDYFIVQTADGRSYTYGNGGNSQVLAPGTTTALSWQVDEVSDPAGNTMTIAYNTTAGSAVPATISWTPNSTEIATYAYTMTFAYGSNVAQGSYSGYEAGSAISNTNLLTSISIENTGATVKKYVLTYHASPTTAREELVQVQECADAEASNCLAPTILTYQSGTVGTATTFTATNFNQPASVAYPLDVNGDGFPDQLYAVPVSGSSTTEHWYVALGTGSGSYGATIDTGVTTNIFGGVRDTVLVGDIAGTGRDGFLYPANGVSGVWNWAYVAPGASTFTLTPTTISAANEYLSILADVNGDGLPDLVYTTPTDGTHIYTLPNTTTPGGTVSFNSTPVTLWTTPSGATTVIDNTAITSVGHVRTVDFNGDGRADLIVTLTLAAVNGRSDVWFYGLVSNGGPASAPVVAPVQLYYDGYIISGTHYSLGGVPTVLDWNDDGCTDLVVPLPSGTSGDIGVALSPCSAAVTSIASWTTVATDLFYQGGAIGTAGAIIPIDWNGDGRTDLLWCSNYDGYAHIALSTGSGVEPSVITGLADNSGVCSSYAADVNGDGLSDLVEGVGDVALHNGTSQPADLLTNVQDGYGNSASPTYAPLTLGVNGFFFPRADAAAGYENYLGPLYVVNGVRFSDPSASGASYSRQHFYSGAWKSLQGRGFAGFEAHQTLDSRNGIYETWAYDLEFPYTGMLTGDTRTQNNTPSTTTYQLTNTPACIIPGSVTPCPSTSQTYFPYVGNSTFLTYELGTAGSPTTHQVRNSTTTYTYDGFGNLLTADTTVTDKDVNSPYYGNSWATNVTNTPDIGTGVGCTSLLTSSVVAYTSTFDTIPVTRTKSFTPDLTNCRYSQIVTEPGSSAYKVTEVLGYDNFGNISQHQVTGIGMAARSTGISWGATGQHPTYVTDASGATTQYTYDPGHDVLTGVIDPNGVATGWIVDGFGRRTQENRPDGTFTVWSYNDCSIFGACPLGSHLLQLAYTVANADSSIQTDGTTWYDAVERPLIAKKRLLASGAYDRNEQRYDSQGRIVQRAMPCVFSALATPCPYMATTAYDLLNRVTGVTRPISASNSTLQSTTYAYNGLQTVVTDPLSDATTIHNDVNGRRRVTLDPKGYQITRAYDDAGSMTGVVDNESHTLWTGSYAYGIAPFMTGMTDADLGTWSFNYDALGERTSWIDADNHTYRVSFDALSRPLTNMGPYYYKKWTWGSSASLHNLGRLQSECIGLATPPVCLAGGYSESWTYDSIGRPLTDSTVIPSSGTYTYTKNYSATTGLLDTLTYPTSTSSYALQLQYGYQNGILASVTDTSDSPNVTVWQANTANPAGQVTQETLGNGLVTNRTFDSVTGALNSIQTGVSGGTGVQNLGFMYDAMLNVTQRQDNNLGMTENFYYDADNRLSYSKLNGTQNLSLTYDMNGNITSRSDVAAGATWTYDPVHFHQVTQAGSSAYTYAYGGNGEMYSRQGTSMLWTEFSYPESISAGSGASAETFSLHYGPDHQRWEQLYNGNGITEATYYVGRQFEIVSSAGVTDYRHYIYAGNEPVAVYSRKSSGTNTFSYLLSDNQSSVAAITNSSGAPVVNESFSAYGGRRDPTTWSGAASSSDLTTAAGITRQGYTFQTALGLLTGLNDMNGRVEDSITGRFLSPDPYISNPDNPQNFNRYSYVLNNPLTYIDPTGFCPQDDGSDDGQMCEVIVTAHNNAYQNGSLDAQMWPATNAVFNRMLQARRNTRRAILGDFGLQALAGIPGYPLFNCLYSQGCSGKGWATAGLVSAHSILEAGVAPAGIVGEVGVLGEAAGGSFGSFSPINPGPLADDIASTFRSGTYEGYTLDSDTTLFRVISDDGNPNGAFWTATEPSGPLQSVIDSALDQSWGNSATTTITRTFPAGTQVFEGVAAPQGGLVGGGSQFYIPGLNP